MRSERRNVSNSRQGLIRWKAECFDAQCLVCWMQVVKFKTIEDDEDDELVEA